ncbi:MAG: YceI family protein [Thermoleophilia bacterium]|nr:YceI family protein [Thermoleophilia bacterium]
MTTATPVATSIPAGTWSLDPLHSIASYRVRHFGITWVRGVVEGFELKINASDDGTVELIGGAPVEKITFPNEQLHGHLMSADFFDAELHPRIEFRSTDIQIGEGGAVTVIGELTIKGQTRPITLKGELTGPVVGLGGDDRIGLELAGEIDRDEFGVSWAATLPSGQDVVARAVKLEGAFELVKS